MAVEELPEYIGGECCSFEAARTLVTWIRESPTLEDRQDRLDHAEALGQLVGETYILPKLWERVSQGLEPGATEDPVLIAFSNPSGASLTTQEEAAIDGAVEKVRQEERRRRRTLGAMTPSQLLRHLGKMPGVLIRPDKGKGGHYWVETANGWTVIQSRLSKEISRMRVGGKLADLGIDEDDFLDA